MTPEVTADNTADLPKPAPAKDVQLEPTNERQSSDWDIQNAPKNYLSLVAAHVATAFFSFASVWLVTRHLGPDGYGAIVAVVAASQLVQIFLNWSSTALARFGIEEFVETGMITRSFWARTIILLPNLLALVLLSGFWLGPVAGWLKIPESAVWLIAVHLVATALWLHIQFAMQGAKMLRLQGIMLAVERALTFLLLLAAIGSAGITLEFALWAYILPAVLLTLTGILVIRPYVALSGFFEAAHFRKMLVFSLPLIPYAIVGYLSTSQLDAFFITRYLSTADLGIYSIAVQINGITGQLAILANSILLSMFVSLKATGSKSTVKNYFENIVPSLTLIWTGFCLTGGLACVFLIPIAFGPSFGDSVIPLWILLCSSGIAFPVYIGLATLTHTYNKTIITMTVSIATAVSNVIFNLLLIPSYGMIGCALATAIAGAVNLIMYYSLLRRDDIVPRSWTLISVLPPVLSALAVSNFQNVWIAFSIFVLTGLAIIVSYSSSVQIATQALIEKYR